MAAIYSLYINNKHGTLIYQKDYSERTAQLTANEKIILASTFHGISGIAARLTPSQVCSRNPLDFIKPKGISVIETAKFKLHCFNTFTGLKFFLVTTPNLPVQTAENLCKKTYELFCDYVLKNPFHDMDMPVRCIGFDKEVKRLLSDFIPSTTESGA